MAVRFATDENFRQSILRGVRRNRPDFDAVSVQDAGMRGADDPTVLGWAASEGWVLLTHDIQTMPAFAYQRVTAGLAMPGLGIIPFLRPIGQAIEDLVLTMDESIDGDWDGQVRYLPMR